MMNSSEFEVGALDGLISALEVQFGATLYEPIEADSNGASSCCTHSCPC